MKSKFRKPNSGNIKKKTRPISLTTSFPNQQLPSSITPYTIFRRHRELLFACAHKIRTLGGSARMQINGCPGFCVTFSLGTRAYIVQRQPGGSFAGQPLPRVSPAPDLSPRHGSARSPLEIQQSRLPSIVSGT